MPNIMFHNPVVFTYRCLKNILCNEVKSTEAYIYFDNKAFSNTGGTQ